MKWYNVAKAIMKIKNITQDDLIPIFAVKTRGAVGHYLCGRRKPDIEQIKALTDMLGCTLDDLMNAAYALKDKDNLEVVNESNALYAIIHKRPPIINDDDWKALPPKARALIEDFTNKIKSEKLTSNDITVLHNMIDALSKDK